MSVSSISSTTIHVRPRRTSSTSEQSDDGSAVDSEQHGDHVRARIDNDGLLIISGAGDLLKRLDVPSITAADDRCTAVAPRFPTLSYHVTNDRGLFPKSYVQQHPEINWVHRGQGLYLPAESNVGSASTAETPRKRQSNEAALDDRQGARSSKQRRNSNTLDVTSSWDTRSSSRTQSPTSTRKQESQSSYSLRQRPVEYEPSSSELREARMLRRLNPSQLQGSSHYSRDDDRQEPNNIYLKNEDDDDDDDDSDDNEDEDDDEARSETKTKHWGNGVSKQDSSRRRASRVSRSIRRKSSSSTADSDYDSDRSTISDNIVLYRPARVKTSTQDDSSHRRASNFSQPTATSSSNEGGLDSEQNATFSKAQMLQYKINHPDVVFTHRGNGRYKMVSKVEPDASKLPTLTPNDRTTYSKDDVTLHPELEFYHCGGGRYKRGPRQTQISEDSDDDDDEEPVRPVQLYDKQYVDEHPELVFHHRGQGRYALGSQSDVSTTGLDSASKNDKDTLYDRAFVDNHPDETFHHRGQGRWARGLPPPGSSSKMAVRGPGAKLVKSTSNSSSGSRGDTKPDPNALFRRDEGPEKWPELDWTYRGGGKWRLSTKQEAAARAAKKAQAERRLEAQADAELASELDSNASASRRGSIQAHEPARHGPKRKRSALQSIELEDASNHARSRSLTPRQPLTLEQDVLMDADLPELFLDQWPDIGPDDTDDGAEHMLRSKFRPLNDSELFVRSMTKHDPSIRPTEVLYRLAEHMQDALLRMQDEYLELDKITAPHARIPRKSVTGGRLPVDPLIFEDRKEADLYDYTFDPKKIGFQDPLAQRIIVDADGRGLRKRRRRNEIDTEAGAQLSEDAPLGRRVPKPVQRFDGNPAPQSRRPRSLLDARASATPDPLTTPEKRAGRDPHAWAESYVAPASGRWANHIPKRIRELRGDSAGPTKSADGTGDGEGSVIGVDVDDDSTDGDSPRKRGAPRVVVSAQSTPSTKVLRSIEDVSIPSLAFNVV